MDKSFIFTKAELEAINRRKNGDKTDRTGIFSRRVKPKIKELISVWFPEKKILKKISKPREIKRND